MKIVLILLFLLVVLAVPGFYWYAISGGEFKLIPLSGKNQDWAALGSYVGGVLGPILSAASILLVWWQSKESAKHLNEQLRQDKLHTKNVTMHAYEEFYGSRKADLIYLLHKISYKNEDDIWSILGVGKGTCD